jgi:hypothetical protein
MDMLRLFSQHWILVPFLFFYISQTSNLKISVELISEPDGFSQTQIFWNSSESKQFEEHRSQHFTTIRGSYVYEVIVPSNSTSFRIDPVSDLGKITLVKVSLKNVFNLPVISWSSVEDFKFWLPSSNVVKDPNSIGSNTFISRAKDPYFSFLSEPNFIHGRVLLADLFYALILCVLCSFINRRLVRPVLVRLEQNKNENRVPQLSQLSLKKRILFATIAVVVSIVAVFLVVEGVYRVYCRNEFQKKLLDHDDTGLDAAEGLRVVQFDRKYWGKERVIKVRENQFKFRLNSLGFRGGEWSTDPKTKKILALGDSYTFGWAVNDDQTYPYILQQKLGNDYQVWNAGVPSYNTSQELGTFQEILKTHRPDFVVLGIVMNDATPAYYRGYSPPSELYKFETFWSWGEIKTFLNYYFPSSREFVKGQKHLFGNTYYAEFSPDGMGWRNLSESLLEINRIAKKNGIPFFAFIFPDVTQALDSEYGYREIHRQLMELNSNDVRIFDLMEIFDGKNAADLRVPWDGHPNEAAFRLTSDFLAKQILK